MTDQVTSIEQSKRLIELGVPADKASMCWVKDPNENEYYLAVHDEYCYEVACLEPIPAFTVADLLELFKSITFTTCELNPALEKTRNNGWDFEFGEISGEETCGYARNKSLVDLLVDRIEWIVSNGYKLNI
nr:hypothetical protein [Alistipes onderdonkii]